MVILSVLTIVSGISRVQPLKISAVNDPSDNHPTCSIDLLFHPSSYFLVHLSSAEDENGAVNFAGENQSVGYVKRRRHIKNNPMIIKFDFSNQAIDACRAQQNRGVRSSCASRHQMKPWNTLNHLNHVPCPR